jgi:(2R)-3-sulfolactate dehydrogenase (NADP+)
LTETIGIAAAETLVISALMRAGASEVQARSTARALIAAECDGQSGHGLSRVPTYVEQLRCGKVRGHATPSLERIGSSAFRVDAAFGFAYPAIDLAAAALIEAARERIIAIAAIRHSHHFGQAGAHVERLAMAGLVAFLFGNSPKAMAFWGGSKPMMGTNPIAFAAPMPDGAPLVIDLALSVAARGRIVAAARAGRELPEGWAFDSAGRPTRDAAEALKGSMAPLGGAKGAALALMVEILAAAVTGSNFGFEASSFLDSEGPPPDTGQLVLAFDPGPLSAGTYAARMRALAAAFAAEAGVRPPGARRFDNRRQADEMGLAVEASLLAQIRALADAAA